MLSIYPRFAVAALLLAAAALTGCNASPSVANMDNLPSFLGSSHGEVEPISTLGANYLIHQDAHRSTRLHELPGHSYSRPTTHRAL